MLKVKLRNWQTLLCLTVSLTTFLTYLITRDTTKALSVLMVDFSCALKLTTPLSVISAMKEASDNRMMVKGGKFLEKNTQLQIQ